MIKLDDIIKTITGRMLKITELIGAGAEGCVAKAMDVKTGKIFAVKIFHPDRSNDHTITRIKYLCAQELHKASSCLVTPIELINSGGMVGYVMSHVQGIPLQQFLETTPMTFMQLLVCLVLVAQALVRLHARKISHGDIRQANVLVWLDGNVPRVCIIDFDNFSAAGAPKPTCLGDEMYLAPEQHESVKAKKPVPPDMGSDKYSFRIMAEEILTLRHPSAAFLEPIERFEHAMYTCWVHDPARPPVPGVGGHPATILNARVANLFRRGMSRDPAKRPELAEWLDELLAAMHEVYVCPKCHKPCLVDASKTVCPQCSKRFPDICLVLPDGRKIHITQGLMQIGRAELNADNMVSAIHAVLRRVGPLVTMECFGMNGTFLKSGDSWLRLEDRKPIFLSPGDVIRFANVEVRVEQVA